MGPIVRQFVRRPVAGASVSMHTDACSPSIRYGDWERRIRMAADLDRLVQIVRDYLASWRPDQLQLLPLEVAATALASSADIPPRAVLAAQADLEAKSDDAGHELLREMALTLSAAATRMRFLATIRGAEGLHESGSHD